MRKICKKGELTPDDGVMGAFHFLFYANLHIMIFLQQMFINRVISKGVTLHKHIVTY